MKSGLDFFPLNVDLDNKFKLIEAEFGVTGFGVVVHLLQEIYGQEGYYIEWTEEVALLFAQKYGVGVSAVSEIVCASIRRGMFDKEIFDKYHVLTSRGIQKRYFDAVSRRKVLEVRKDILLVDIAQICKNVNIEFKNVNISAENDDSGEQSKVKKSKEEKSKGKNTISTEPQAPSVLTLTLNDGSEYPITQADIDEWQTAFPNVDIVQQLHAMKLWCKDNPKRRKTKTGVRRFVTSWLDREQNRGGYKPNVPRTESTSSSSPPDYMKRERISDEEMRRQMAKWAEGNRDG